MSVKHPEFLLTKRALVNPITLQGRRGTTDDFALISIIDVTDDATHRPVAFFRLHAGIVNYLHHGGQRYQNFVLQPTKG